MKSEEFCKACKHHYTFHNMGKGECEKLYPPRTIENQDDIIYSKYIEVNSCYCKKFDGEEEK